MNVIIAGDYCPTERLVPMIESGQYGRIFDGVKTIVTSADYSIVNLECPVIGLDSAAPIVKCGPNLRCSSKAIDALKYVGFNCATLANNHFRDYGNEGCLSTIAELKIAHIDYVGGGSDLKESQHILYKEIDGEILGIVNVCEHESSIATYSQAGSAPFDYVDVYNAICKARSTSDYVLVIVHGGNEHYQLPSPRMKKAYRWFVELGADAVINHHQHCYSGYEVYQGKPIFYGIGNFCFDNALRSNSMWNEGFMVELSFCNGVIDFKLYPYSQCKDSPSIVLKESCEREMFDLSISELNGLILSDDELLKRYVSFCKEMSAEWLFKLEPYKNNRFLLALYRRQMLPSFITRDKAKWLINFIECESQVPRLLSALYTKI